MAFPDSSEVTQAFESAENGQQGGSDLAPDASPAAAPTAAPSIAELDKLEKFKFEGQEYTPKELKSAILRQQDYTRKAQEISQDRKYYDNLSADLDHVRKNPALAAEFRKLYPAKFHAFLEHVSGQAGTPSAPQPEQGSSRSKYAELDPEIVSRFERMESTVFQDKVQAIETSLEATEKELCTKYPMADVETVYAKAQALLDKNKDLPDFEKVQLNKEVWDRIYKADHDKNQKRYETHYKEQLNKQKQAGLKGRDSGNGGGMPGGAPARHKNIKEATEAARRDFGLDS